MCSIPWFLLSLLDLKKVLWLWVPWQRVPLQIVEQQKIEIGQEKRLRGAEGKSLGYLIHTKRWGTQGDGGEQEKGQLKLGCNRTKTYFWRDPDKELGEPGSVPSGGVSSEWGWNGMRDASEQVDAGLRVSLEGWEWESHPSRLVLGNLLKDKPGVATKDPR